MQWLEPIEEQLQSTITVIVHCLQCRGNFDVCAVYMSVKKILEGGVENVWGMKQNIDERIEAKE